jgi:hypothetical protein
MDPVAAAAAAAAAVPINPNNSAIAAAAAPVIAPPAYKTMLAMATNTIGTLPSLTHAQTTATSVPSNVISLTNSKQSSPHNQMNGDIVALLINRQNTP